MQWVLFRRHLVDVDIFDGVKLVTSIFLNYKISLEKLIIEKSIFVHQVDF